MKNSQKKKQNKETAVLNGLVCYEKQTAACFPSRSSLSAASLRRKGCVLWIWMFVSVQAVMEGDVIVIL